MAVWTEEELKILKCAGSNTTAPELQALLPNHTVTAIALKRHRVGILYHKGDPNLVVPGLSSTCAQILFGSLLGDGSIVEHHKGRYILQEQHSKKQMDYVVWKAEHMPELLPCLSLNNKKGPVYSTVSFPMFSVLREEMYGTKGRKNRVAKCILEGLDFLGLLVWYLDDGTWTHPPVIGKKIFMHEDLMTLVQSLEQRLKIVIGAKQRRGYFFTSFPKRGRDYLFSKWRGLFDLYHIPDCMRYKLGPYA